MELNGEVSNFGYFIQNDFYCNIQSFRDCPETKFNCKLLLIGINSAKGIFKNVSIRKVGVPAPAPPTPPIIKVFLLHTEQTVCPDTVSLIL